jgi:hypothetical protein
VTCSFIATNKPLRPEPVPLEGCVLRSLWILVGLMGLSACGGEENDAGTRTIEGRGNTFDEAIADVERQLGPDEYRPATPEETEEAIQLAMQALADMRDKRPSAEIAAALNEFQYGGGASGYFDLDDFPYKPAEFGQITNLGPDAAADGIGGAAGFILEAEDEPYKTVLVSYLVFDDFNDARDYRDKLDRNFTQSVIEYEIIDLTSEDSADIEAHCSFVPDANNAVSCYYLGPSERVVAVLLFGDGPYLDFSRGMRAIDLVFDNAEADFRIRYALGQSAGYLVDGFAP